MDSKELKFCNICLEPLWFETFNCVQCSFVSHLKCFYKIRNNACPVCKIGYYTMTSEFIILNIHLLKKFINSEVDFKDKEGITLLIACCGEKNKEDELSMILDAESSPEYINTIDNVGNTALITACFFGYDNYTTMLCKIPGLNPNIQNRRGKTALMFAVENEYYNIVLDLLLLENIDVNIQDNRGNTILHLAIIYHSNTILDLILRVYRLDISIKNDRDENLEFYWKNQVNYRYYFSSVTRLIKRRLLMEKRKRCCSLF